MGFGSVMRGASGMIGLLIKKIDTLQRGGGEDSTGRVGSSFWGVERKGTRQIEKQPYECGGKQKVRPPPLK